MTEGHGMAYETLERFRDRLLPRRVDQNVSYEFTELVTGRAVNWPVLSQGLVPGQNFFHDQIDDAAVVRQRKTECGRGFALQFLEIFLRQIEAVGVIDPHSGDCPFCDQLEQ